VQVIGSGAGDDGELADAGVFGESAGDLEAELLVAFGAVGHDAGDLAAEHGGDGDAVNGDVALPGAAAAEAHIEAALGLGDIGGELDEVPGAAEAERHVDHRLAGAGVGDAGGFGLDEGDAGGDLNGGGHLAELEGDVDAADVARAEHDAVHEVFLEALGGGFEAVGAFQQVGQGIVARLVGGSGVFVSGAEVDRFDGGSGDGGAGGVGDRTGDAGQGALGGERERGPKEEGKNGNADTKSLAGGVIMKHARTPPERMLRNGGVRNKPGVTVKLTGQSIDKKGTLTYKEREREPLEAAGGD
jgi:hypothetical protein